MGALGPRSSFLCFSFAAMLLAGSAMAARELTFEERLRAQEAIERVYYAHQSAVTRPFEEAVPRALLIDKVRGYLKRTVALEEFWNTPVTAEMLEQELARMAHRTTMPERLRELFAALGDDPFLVQECLARPLLVDRLARGLFAADEPRAASFTAPRRDWDSWWRAVADGLDEGRVAPVASTGMELPVPGSAPCLADNTWSTGLATGDVPAGRKGFTAVWTGNLMLVWGGFGSNSAYLNSGGRYDAVTDTWTAMSSMGAPLPRSSHTGVWTGDEMVVWGGDGANGFLHLNTGGRYDPVRDAWTATSVEGAPSPRFYHTAVWTGEEMIVWGGWGGGGSGGRYTPATDSWTPVETQNAPIPRAHHTAVWTGQEMIIWGGSNPETSEIYLNSGGRYDPVTHGWKATSTVNAPAGRYRHTALWAGSKVVVWGGDAGTPGLNTGGRYDPGTDSWMPTATTGIQGVYDHTAVWTGSEMLVWGGAITGAAEVNSGKRYSPTLNSWALMSNAEAPSARSLHQAVWTGSFMLVWGGRGPDGPALATGGRYALGHDTDDDGDRLSECAGDCNDADPGAFALPMEVEGLTFAADKTTLSWTSAAAGAGSGTVHDVLRGLVDEYPVGLGPGESCLVPGGASATASDPSTPAVGAGYWYLVRGHNSCGAGTYGFTSAGSEKTSSACP